MKTKRKKLTQNSPSGHVLLVDGDILLFRIGCTTNDVSEDIAKVRMNSYIDELLNDSFCSDYRIFLTDGENNFRRKIYPEYKANRVAEKPLHYYVLRDYLIRYEKAEIAYGMEADDLLGIEQTDNTIIASIDKDLDQVEGAHYNFVKKIHYEITHNQGRHKFWTQMLTGDTVDNIPGIRGIGPKKAEKLLADCTTDAEYKAAIINAYTELTTIEDINSHLNLIGKLLWIRREHNQMWELHS